MHLSSFGQWHDYAMAAGSGGRYNTEAEKTAVTKAQRFPMNSIRHPSSRHLLLQSIALLFILTLTDAQAVEVTGQPVPEADIQLLPPVCKLILVEMPGIHMRNGGPYTKFEYLLDQPPYRMAKNTPWLHHYCWALINKMRYFRAKTDTERTFWFSTIITNINFVLDRVPKDWPYFHILLMEQGLMMRLQGDYDGSLEKAKEALEHKPDEQRAYALEFDDYIAMKDKKKALAAAEEGLKKDPSSKILRKRLEQLGVTPPPPTQANQVNQDTPGATSSKASATTHLDKDAASTVNTAHDQERGDASEGRSQPDPQNQEKPLPVEIK